MRGCARAGFGGERGRANKKNLIISHHLPGATATTATPPRLDESFVFLAGAPALMRPHRTDCVSRRLRCVRARILLVLSDYYYYYVFVRNG